MPKTRAGPGWSPELRTLSMFPTWLLSVSVCLCPRSVSLSTCCSEDLYYSFPFSFLVLLLIYCLPWACLHLLMCLCLLLYYSVSTSLMNSSIFSISFSLCLNICLLFNCHCLALCLLVGLSCASWSPSYLFCQFLPFCASCFLLVSMCKHINRDGVVISKFIYKEDIPLRYLSLHGSRILYVSEN